VAGIEVDISCFLGVLDFGHRIRRFGVKYSGLLGILLQGIVAIAQQMPASASPSVTVSYPGTRFNVRARDVCGLDFQNIRLKWDRGWEVQLRKGQYDHRDKSGGFQSVSLDDVHCLDADGRNKKHVLIESTWTEGQGSSNNECVVQVLTLQSGYPVVIQQLEFDCHALSTGSAFDSASKKLTVRARTDDDSPHCCARTLDVVSYVWKDARFKRQDFQRIPAVVEKGPDGMEYH
jgi:hypothetical protein